MTLIETRSILFTILLLSFSLPIQAGEIVNLNWFSGVASVAGTVIGPLVDPNNDDVAGDSSNVFIVAQKHYTGIGPVDIEFDVVPSGGVNEYFVMEGVDNSTPWDWSSYRIVLGFGVGADFEESDPGDELDFDAPDYNSPPDFSLNFSTVDESEDVLLARGGIHSNTLGSSYAEYTFSFDVPDLPPGVTKFTLRQQPIAVPEPASVAIAGLTTLAMLAWRRKGCMS